MFCHLPLFDDFLGLLILFRGPGHHYLIANLHLGEFGLHILNLDAFTHNSDGRAGDGVDSRPPWLHLLDQRVELLCFVEELAGAVDDALDQDVPPAEVDMFIRADGDSLGMVAGPDTEVDDRDGLGGREAVIVLEPLPLTG